MSRVEFRVFATPAEVAEAAAEGFVAAARDAVAARGQFVVALSGGRTPHMTYHLLRTAPVPWSQTHVFWGDDRAVSQDDPASNAGEARRALLDDVDGVTIHPMDCVALDLDTAARDAEAELRAVAGGPLPVLDLVWLGMGADGHTASLFPGSPALTETERLVVATSAPGGATRLTMTFPLLNAARQVTLLVTGADKAVALAGVQAGDPGLPATAIAAAQVSWLLDAAAVR